MKMEKCEIFVKKNVKINIGEIKLEIFTIIKWNIEVLCIAYVIF